MGLGFTEMFEFTNYLIAYDVSDSKRLNKIQRISLIVQVLLLIVTIVFLIIMLNLPKDPCKLCETYGNICFRSMLKWS